MTPMLERFLASTKAEIEKKAEVLKEAPFKSQAQRRKFYAMANRGEISKKTVKEWESETPKNKKLPERVKKTADLNATTFAQMGGDFAFGKLSLFNAIHNSYIDDNKRASYGEPLQKEALASLGKVLHKPLLGIGKGIMKGIGAGLGLTARGGAAAAKGVGKGAVGVGRFAWKHPIAGAAVIGTPIAFGAGLAGAKPKVKRVRKFSSDKLAGVVGTTKRGRKSTTTATSAVKIKSKGIGGQKFPTKQTPFPKMQPVENPIESIKNLLVREQVMGPTKPVTGMGVNQHIQRVGV